MMKKFLSLSGWLFAVIILSTSMLWASGTSLPFLLYNSSGSTLFQVDTSGRTVQSATSPTTAQGVSQGFVTGSATKEFAVLFKDSTGTAVAMPNTNYAVFVQVEESTGLVGAAEPTTVLTKTTAGFTIATDNNLATTHTLRWHVIRF